MDILANNGLFVLPLGFKLPFKLEDFLTKKLQIIYLQNSQWNLYH